MLGFLGPHFWTDQMCWFRSYMILRTVTFYASLTHSRNVPFVHPTQHPQPQQRQPPWSSRTLAWSAPPRSAIGLCRTWPDGGIPKEVDNSRYFNNHQESQHISTQPSPNLATRWPLTKALGAFESSSSQPSCKVFEPRMDHNRRPLFQGISPAKLAICCQAVFPLLAAVAALMHLDICQHIYRNARNWRSQKVGWSDMFEYLWYMIFDTSPEINGEVARKLGLLHHLLKCCSWFLLCWHLVHQTSHMWRESWNAPNQKNPPRLGLKYKKNHWLGMKNLLTWFHQVHNHFQGAYIPLMWLCLEIGYA